MKSLFTYLPTAFIIIGLYCSCDDPQKDIEGETGAQVITKDAVQGPLRVVTISGQVKGLDAVALDFEYGIDYSADPGFCKDSTIRVKIDGDYSDKEYSINIFDLESGRKYYYRAYYINQLLLNYGKTKDFSFNWGTSYWQGSDGYYYTFNDDHTVILTDSTGYGSPLSWNIIDNKLVILANPFAGFVYIIESITPDIIELYKDNDPSKTIIELTPIEKSEIPSMPTPAVFFSCEIMKSPYNQITTPSRFLSIRKQNSSLTITDSDGNIYEEPLSAIQNSSFVMGLAGLILGTPTFNNDEMSIWAYDLGCPDCFDSKIRLRFNQQGIATCSKCGGSWDLNRSGSHQNTSATNYLIRHTVSLNNGIITVNK